MKILIVANYNANKGGISGVVFNHYQKLSEEGYSVQIFSTKNNVLFRILIIFPLIAQVVRKDIVHIHGCSYFGFFPIVVGILAGKVICRKKSIVTYHGGDADRFLARRSRFVRWFLTKADCVTVMSDYLRAVYAKYNISTVVLPNILNINCLNNGRIDWDKSYPKLLSIRRLTETYNIPDIIEAYKIVKRRYPKATLQIAGTGSLSDQIVKSIEGVEGITYLGLIDNKDVPKLMQENNILISVPRIDNQPMTLLEAFACRIPVISSNVGGVPYMITDTVNGLLVEVNNPKQISEKIEWLMENPERTKKIVNEAAKEVQKYCWESVGKKLLSLYGCSIV